MTADRNIRYQVCLARLGWRQGIVSNGMVAGTVGLSLQMEAIIVYNLPTNFQYRVHLANQGWLNWVDQGKIAGTVGQCRRLEALQFRDSGLAVDMSLVVIGKAHVQNQGWQNISSAMEPNFLGTIGQSLRMEAIQLRLLTSLNPLAVKTQLISTSSEWN